MIEIQELRPSSDGRGWAFGASIDGQTPIGCQLLELRPRRLRLPQSTAIDWGAHNIADIQRAAEHEISKIGEPRNV